LSDNKAKKIRATLSAFDQGFQRLHIAQLTCGPEMGGYITERLLKALKKSSPFFAWEVEILFSWLR
jgi:hypothetical protein